MDGRYEAYTMADRTFYDAMHSRKAAGESFAVAERPLPEGWRRYEQDDWIVVDPQPVGLPTQGWKIHASATPDSAVRVLEAVWDYCVPRGIEFKFLRSPAALTARVSKYAPRGYSGKLVTIYPADDGVCEQILNELGKELEGVPNPYILSDLRWGSGPLFVRYGAFSNQYTVDEDGRVVSAIAAPDGTLVADKRGPVFSPPAWAKLPAFLEPHLAARNAVTISDLPYSIERVLHYSNGGGIYLARDTRTDEKVVLKEGRPHSGLDGHGHDAVRRVELEHGMLRRLDGIPGIPRARDLLWVGEHRFLVMDYVDAVPLSKAIVRQYPLINQNSTPEDYQRFTDWAVDVHRQASELIAAVHERGIVYGDIHLNNLLVRDDDTVALLDFEVATSVEDAQRPGLGNQGFAAPGSSTGFDIDLYALACLRLALFLPMTELLWLHRIKARHYAEIIAENFPVPPEFLKAGVDVIAPPEVVAPPHQTTDPDPERWPALRADLVRAIVASATPERDDRLFPGDVQQFGMGGLGLAYGAAGVLYAIDVTGGGRYPEYEDWLIRHTRTPAGGSRLGLYDGLHGAAFTLHHLGHRSEALDLVDVCLKENWETLGPDLFGGLAGIGLNLLHLAGHTGESGLRDAAQRAADLVAARLELPDSDSTISGREGFAGLMRGCAGQALFMMRMHDETADPAYLDLAAEALRRDLRRCVVREDSGAMEVHEGWRTMPYLEAGSVGVGLALDAYLTRRADPRFAQASADIERAARSHYYILPGLFVGRAGILLYRAGRTTQPLSDPLVARQVRNLAWHALPYAEGMAFPGTGLLRLSMDLATGTAGVLLALGSALHDQPVQAPLLPLTAARPTPAAATPQAPVPTGAGSHPTGK
ncbi:MAG: protein kinase/lanthionine synthetase C family protein [Catenulispora sp.]|nr:protein kinase/lanthionine synthetase C family protein [Catenulispora sp.]